MWLLYPKEHANARSLVIRKYSEDLKDWIDRAERVYNSFGAKKVGQPAEFHFPSGYKIVTGHLKDASSYTKYQGHEYQRVLVEELPQISSEELYLKLISSCRSTTGLKPMVFCTGNPGNVGQAWVSKRFVEPRPYYTEFEVGGKTRIYIHATVDDNPSLALADPGYVQFLDSLPEDLRKQWRYGDWSSVEVKGSYFGEDVKTSIAQGRVCQFYPFPNIPVDVMWDLGVNDEQVAIFYQLRGLEIRVLDILHGNNQRFDYYVEQLRERYYQYGTIRLPHDGNKRSPDSLRSFRDVLESNGYTVEVVPRTNDKLRDIQSARSIFPQCFFESEHCGKLLEALRIYRKQWNEERQAYDDKPYHDWSSNFADAFLGLAVSLPRHNNNSDLEAQKAISGYINPRPSFIPPGQKPTQYLEEQQALLAYLRK